MYLNVKWYFLSRVIFETTHPIVTVFSLYEEYIVLDEVVYDLQSTLNNILIHSHILQCQDQTAGRRVLKFWLRVPLTL